MTLRKQLYDFGTLEAKSALIVQDAIEKRKATITADQKEMNMPEKILQAKLEELDEMYDSLSRYLAELVRNESKGG